MNSSSSSSCSIEVGYELTMNEEDVPDLSSALVFRVPQAMRDSNLLYSPHLVSIGPFHHGKEELKGMEKSKSEAVRRMQKRIQRNDQNASIKSIVEESILVSDKEIRNFYGEDISYPDIQLAWMVTRDACFVYEFIVNYVGKCKPDDEFYMEEVTQFYWMYDPVFDLTVQSPTRQELMDDILLFENQIPLWVLQHLFQVQMGDIDAASKKLDFLMGLLLVRSVRHSAFMWTSLYPFHKCGHVLEALYLGMGGSIVPDYHLRSEALQVEASSRNCIQILFENGFESVKAICGRWCKPCLCFLSSNTDPDELNRLILLKLPTAVELTSAGVKIYPVTSEEAMASHPGYSPISWIRFDEKTSRLYLPQGRVTPESDSFMRNSMAMELSTEVRYHPRPMTQFALFMDELIDSEEDVAVLRNADAIHNFLGSNQQVAHRFASLTKGIAPVGGCEVIDDVRRGLHKYTKRKYKILWSEFVSAYFSKPWLVAGSMAAVLLLLMTVSQVFCLFFTCNS